MSDETDVVWSATVDDGTYSVIVTRNPGTQYNGDLTVRHIASDEVILSEVIGLSYGAIFGPDASDVAAWQITSLDAIDAWLADQKVRQENEGTGPSA